MKNNYHPVYFDHETFKKIYENRKQRKETLSTEECFLENLKEISRAIIEAYGSDMWTYIVTSGDKAKTKISFEHEED